MKTPKFLSKLSAVLTPRPRKKLQATARALPRAAMDDYEDEEPTTKLSNAFIVVFILHVVAIGGIYAFTCIKESRQAAAAPAPATPTVVAEKPKSPAATEARSPGQSSTPATPTEMASLNTAPVPAAVNPKPNPPGKHIVKAGENPTKIAIAYGVRTEDLLAANNLKPGALLQPNQILTIPKPAAKVADVKPDAAPKQTDVPPTKTTPGLRIVKKGDTATSIAKTFGITTNELLKYNKIPDTAKLQLGQVLKIPPKKG
jgi:LysM repeat protein